jgi:hypothetical protein
MANVSVKLDIKYHVTRKDGNKEVGQKIVKQSLYFPVMSEAQFTAMREYIDTVDEAADLIPD